MKDILTAKDRIPKAREIIASKKRILEQWLEEIEYSLCCRCSTPEERYRDLYTEETISDSRYGFMAGWLNDFFMGKRT